MFAPRCSELIESIQFEMDRWRVLSEERRRMIIINLSASECEKALGSIGLKAIFFSNLGIEADTDYLCVMLDFDFTERFHVLLNGNGGTPWLLKPCLFCVAVLLPFFGFDTVCRSIGCLDDSNGSHRRILGYRIELC